jgi:hypothetical protein
MDFHPMPPKPTPASASLMVLLILFGCPFLRRFARGASLKATEQAFTSRTHQAFADSLS